MGFASPHCILAMIVFLKTMWRSIVKIVLAGSFMLLLTVPVEFYRSGGKGALNESAFILGLFAFVLTPWGRRWSSIFETALPPRSFDDRILTGLALTLVFALSAEVQVRLGAPLGVILGGFISPFLIGLFGHPYGGWWFTRPGFWKKREYAPATAILGTLIVPLVILSWSTWHWWSLLIVPTIFLGIELGMLTGRSIRNWVLALREVWEMARRMGPPIGGFVLGYLVISSIFAGLFASVWRADSLAFRGLPEHPHLLDFAYYSVMTITTTGYGDVVPRSSLAKILASAEALIGLAWTVVIFAAVFTVVQRRIQQPDTISGH